MDCNAFRQASDELETGQPASAAAQAHVDSCAACRSFQAERLSLRHLIGSLGPIAAPPDFDFRLRARLAKTQSEGHRYFHRTRFAPGLKAISVAASFALLIAAAVVFKPLQSGRETPSVIPNPAVAANTNKSAENSKNQPRLILQETGSEVAPPSIEQQRTASLPRGAAPPAGVETLDALVKSARNRYAGRLRRPTIFSNEATFGANTPVILPAPPSAGEAAASLNISNRPLKMVVHDGQGEPHAITLEPVIFGAQDFLERAARRRKAGLDNEGIW